MGTIDGTLILHKGESLVEASISWADRHEVATGSQSISSPAIDVLDSDGDTSSDLTVTGVTVVGDAVQFKVTVEDSAVEGAEYELKNWVTLSGGARVNECLIVSIEPC